MKFYIDGKLVRTSKTHDYTHALMWHDSVISCHGSYEQAVKALNRKIAERNYDIENNRAAIKAIDEGRTNYLWKFGRERWQAKVSEPRENYEATIVRLKECITHYHVRELEAR